MNEYTVEFSQRASDDLDGIAAYIARDNPSRAVSFIAELRVHCQRISAMPLAFPPRLRLGRDVRVSIRGSYLIYFRVLETSRLARIEHVRHGTRRPLRRI